MSCRRRERRFSANLFAPSDPVLKSASDESFQEYTSLEFLPRYPQPIPDAIAPDRFQPRHEVEHWCDHQRCVMSVVGESIREVFKAEDVRRWPWRELGDVQTILTSMGPRLFSADDQHPKCNGELLFLASMGPRLFGVDDRPRSKL